MDDLYINSQYLEQLVVKMIKLKEILFLKNLKGVGKSAINSKYMSILKESDDFYDLVSEVELTSKFDTSEIKIAMDKAENAYDELFNSDINVITAFDEKYPEKLKIMGNKKPPLLYIKGNIDALDKPNISIIGTRKPLAQSQEFERELVKNILNSTDKVIISGLALGCDKIAHQTTVDENKYTIAVLPSGVNVIKPAKHKKLAQDIIDTGGCLVSEYDPNATVYKSTYVERDRIVAAFSDATFVVECGIKSGTMHTVNFAKEYNRQLFCYLPQDRPNESYDGNRFILKNNNDAIKVENIEKFLNDLKNASIDNKEKSEDTTQSIQPTLDSF